VFDDFKSRYNKTGRRTAPIGQFKSMAKRLKKFMTAEVEGIGVVEIILILVVIIGLVVIFRDEIQAIVTELFDNINESITNI
jgi:hypothetical protein